MNFIMDIFKHMTKIRRMVLFALFIFFAGPISAFAISADLTVSSASVVNGQSVTLTAELTGPISGCAIRYNSFDTAGNMTSSGYAKDLNGNNIVIDTSSIEGNSNTIIKQFETKPLENSVTKYYIFCANYQSTYASVFTKPDIQLDLSSPSGNFDLDPVNGYVKIKFSWSSPNAIDCSDVRMRKRSGQMIIFQDQTGYYGKNKSEGYLELYAQTPDLTITDDAIFYITCTNDAGSKQESVSLEVTNNNQPLPPVEVSIDSPDKTNGVTLDPVFGYATTEVTFSSINAQKCELKAYDKNGVAYNVDGWIAYSNTGGTRKNLEIDQDTTFEASCWRDIDNSSDTKQLTINVHNNGGGNGNGGANGNGGSPILRPQVTANITADPNPTQKRRGFRYARSRIILDSEYADRCQMKMYKLSNPTVSTGFSGFPGQKINMYANGGHFERNLDRFTESVQINLECWRSRDINSPDLDVRNRAYATSSVIISVEEPVGYSSAPNVSLYANAVRYRFNDMLYSSLPNNNFSIENGRLVSQSSSQADLSFVFEHPYASSTNSNFFSTATFDYDVYLTYCDTDGGEATYELFVDGVKAGEFQTDPNYKTPGDCDSIQGSEFEIKDLVKDYRLRHGDILKIVCTPTANSKCVMGDLYLGPNRNYSLPQQAGALEYALPVPKDGATVPLMWVNSNLSFCTKREKENLITGSVTNWSQYPPGNLLRFGYFRSPSNTPVGYGNTKVVSKTEFRLVCNDDNGNEIKDSVTVLPMGDFVSNSQSVGTGECRVDTAAGGVPVSGYNDGDMISNPPANIGPDSNDVCIYLVDLISDIKAPVFSGANGRAGTYSNVQSKLRIKNDGDGDLPAGRGVTYLSKITINNPTRFGLTSSQFDSPVNRFNGTVSSKSSSNLLQTTVHNIPFGTHQLEVRVNVDDPNAQYPEYDSTGSSLDPYSNNIAITSITLPVPRPPMSLTVDKTLVQKGKDVTVSWSAVTDYSGMDCTVKGPGIDVSFASNDSSANGDFGNISKTVTMNSAGEFVLKCTEQTTNTSFEEKVSVEVVPGVEET